jgi:hypothetical protein
VNKIVTREHVEWLRALVAAHEDLRVKIQQIADSDSIRPPDADGIGSLEDEDPSASAGMLRSCEELALILDAAVMSEEAGGPPLPEPPPEYDYETDPVPW